MNDHEDDDNEADDREDDDNEADEREVEIMKLMNVRNNDDNEENDDHEDDEHDIDHEMHDDDNFNFINQSYSNTFQENICHEYTKVVLVSQPYSAS